MIAFITVHYNTPEEIKDYVRSIAALDRVSSDILVVVVDSGSSAQQLAEMKLFVESSYFPGISLQLIEANENLGYLRGLNRGIAQVKLKSIPVEYWILGNNDVLFEKDFLIQLYKVRYDRDTLVLAPNIKNASGVYENPHEIEPIPKSRLKLYDLYYSNYFVGTSIMKLYGLVNRLFTNPRRFKMKKEKVDFMNIHFCTGCKFILTRHFFEHYEQLRDDVFLWAEEVLISYQVWSINKKMLYCPTLKMYHKLSVATGKLPSRKKYNQMRDAHWKVRPFHKLQ